MLYHLHFVLPILGFVFTNIYFFVYLYNFNMYSSMLLLVKSDDKKN